MIKNGEQETARKMGEEKKPELDLLRLCDSSYRLRTWVLITITINTVIRSVCQNYLRFPWSLVKLYGQFSDGIGGRSECGRRQSVFLRNIMKVRKKKFKYLQIQSRPVSDFIINIIKIYYASAQVNIQNARPYDEPIKKCSSERRFCWVDIKFGPQSTPRAVARGHGSSFVIVIESAHPPCSVVL